MGLKGLVIRTLAVTRSEDSLDLATYDLDGFNFFVFIFVPFD